MEACGVSPDEKPENLKSTYRARWDCEKESAVSCRFILGKVLNWPWEPFPS